nr:unnamed protein product [Naegleria fowleri]
MQTNTCVPSSCSDEEKSCSCRNALSLEESNALVPTNNESSSKNNSSQSSDNNPYAGVNLSSSIKLQNSVPASIMENEELNRLIKETLPSNYNFEIHKTIHRIQQIKPKRVALQFPEGLLLFSCVISDIIERFCPETSTVIMGDVTYGACCIDDFTAQALGADFMVHYAHSCLVPVSECCIKNILYVFVDIQIDINYFVQSMINNFPKDTKMAMVATIQFVSSLRTAKAELDQHFTSPVYIPQVRPLSPGEILGCTSPKELSKLHEIETLVYLGDGRFHLESVMIQNPELKFYKYDPYGKKLTEEYYDHTKLHSIRQDAIEKAKHAKKFGIILGTLGRQGSPKVLQTIERMLNERNIPYVTILLSEIFPSKLSLLHDVECWIQIACPRLSIDWGHFFDKPLLSPYESQVALQAVEWKSIYPMDFYSLEGGEWSVKHYEKMARSVGTLSATTTTNSNKQLRERMKALNKK